MVTVTVEQVLATRFYMSERIEKKDKKIAIVQSNYIPWKGYFDLINKVHEFILFDDMQYTRRDWRNRNKIKTPQGLQWLTIPVQVKGKFLQKINQTYVGNPNWASEHWKTLIQNYARAPYFRTYRETFEELYLGCSSLQLSKINHRFISAICNLLGITSELSWSSDYRIIDGKTERLVNLCQQAEAAEYISGPSAKGYIDPDLFKKAGIKLTFMDYSDYPEYPQLYPPFEHGVSIVDLLFNIGPDAPKYMNSFTQKNL